MNSFRLYQLPILLLIGLSLSSNPLNAQDTFYRLPTWEKGTINLQLSYGYPNIQYYVWKSNFAAEEIDKLSQTGTISFKSMFFVNNEMSIDLLVNSAMVNLSYQKPSDNYEYERRLTSLRIIPEVTYHFDELQGFPGALFYSSFGIGYFFQRDSETSNNPEEPTITRKPAIPICVRINGGFNYFLSNSFGLNLELGIGGGPFMSAGVSYTPNGFKN